MLFNYPMPSNHGSYNNRVSPYSTESDATLQYVSNKLKKKKDNLNNALSVRKQSYNNKSNLPPVLVWFTIFGGPIYLFTKGCILDNLPVNRVSQCQSLMEATDIIGSGQKSGHHRMITKLTSNFEAFKRGNSQEMMFMLLQIYRLFRDEHGHSQFPKLRKIEQYYSTYPERMLWKFIEKGVDKDNVTRGMPLALNQLMADFTGPPQLRTEKDDNYFENSMSSLQLN